MSLVCLVQASAEVISSEIFFCVGIFAIKMSLDMEFDYKVALRRQNFTEYEVNELRKKAEKLENVPKNLSSKKVRMSIMAGSASR